MSKVFQFVESYLKRPGALYLGVFLGTMSSHLVLKPQETSANPLITIIESGLCAAVGEIGIEFVIPKHVLPVATGILYFLTLNNLFRAVSNSNK